MSEALPSSGRRRAALRRRRRQQRRRMVGAALAGALVLLAVVTAYFVQRDEPAPTVAVERGRTQQTLLLQLAGADGAAVGSALLAHDPATAAGAVLLVPSQVLATPPGSGPLPFGQALAVDSDEAVRHALADLVGVTVDAGWVLDLPTLAALVDTLGGVDVDVDAAVPAPDGVTVALQPGRQPLSGAQAATYAGVLGPGEPEQARLARLQRLLDGLLAALPSGADQVAGVLGGLGQGSVPGGTDARGLAAVLLGLRDDDRGAALRYDVLPVVVVDTAAAQPSLRLDADRSRAVVDRLLAGSVPAGARQGGRVKVFNGVGTPMLGEAVRAELVAAGLVYVPGGNAPRFGVARSEVQIGLPTPESLALGRRVATVLGLPADAVRTSPPTSAAEVVVVVGADFVPG